MAAHFFRDWLCLLPIALACNSCSSDSGDSTAFTSLTSRSKFEFVPLTVDDSGAVTAGSCEDRPGVFAVYETQLSSLRYYRFCRDDGRALVLGQITIGYGTPIAEGRFSWTSERKAPPSQLPGPEVPTPGATGPQTNETIVIAYYADDNGDGTAETTRLHVNCWTEPALGVVSTTEIFAASVGTQVCTTPGFEASFPVKYYIASLSPLRFRVVVPDGSEHALEMYELPGSGAVVRPAAPLCGLSRCI
ncbi:MAG TPA: hypothetical protein VJV79_01585 [Polyangiaceae bacterium]|nr:hypothetical protein [Polyangiaceae bacterium]